MRVAVTIALEWSWQRPDRLDVLTARVRRGTRALVLGAARHCSRTTSWQLRDAGLLSTQAEEVLAEPLTYSAGPGLPGSLLTWWQRWRQRRALADLDDHRLEDIGISRAEAAREARKPFWRA
jgi:uncharacterized protein YjiS (DUF1127 family)